MSPERKDPYAPVQRDSDFRKIAHRAWLIRDALLEQYRRLHGHERAQEMSRFHDGIAWAGPAKFVLPIDLVAERMPNMRVLSSVEQALHGIVGWPNARQQAFQLKQYIRYGAEEELYKPVAQIGRLMAKIAQEKPYGEQTVGINLLYYTDWETVYWERNFGDGVSMKGVFADVLQSLTAFSRGKYAQCINDYPGGPFWRLKAIPNFEDRSPEERVAYMDYIIRTYYPILAERPSLAKRLFKQ